MDDAKDCLKVAVYLDISDNKDLKGFLRFIEQVKRKNSFKARETTTDPWLNPQGDSFVLHSTSLLRMIFTRE